MSDISQDNLPYQSYDQVPWFRKNWFLIVSYIVFAPAIFFILISGDVYYEKKGKLQKYGKGAKIFLIVISALISLQLISWIGKSEGEESAPNNSSQVMVESASEAQQPIKSEEHQASALEPNLNIVAEDAADQDVDVAADMVVVPAPIGECDYEYDKTLKNAGLIAKAKSIHGPDDQDFAGYGCPYRIKPAPGTEVEKGSAVSYRSAWEAG